MFVVRCAPLPCPQPAVAGSPLHTLCAHLAHTPPPGQQHAPRTVLYVPCLRPSAERARLQPAPELGHLQRHGHAQHLLRALLAAPPAPQTAVTPTLLHALLAPRSRPVHPREAARASPLITPLMPSLWLGSSQTPSPPTTSCSSAARGRAPPPSPPRAMARAGRREAAPEALTEVCVRPRQSPWRLPVPQPATHVRGDRTYTDVRAGRRKQTSSGCGCLTSARECRSSMCVLRIEMCCRSAPTTRCSGGAYVRAKTERHTPRRARRTKCDVLIRLYTCMVYRP